MILIFENSAIMFNFFNKSVKVEFIGIIFVLRCIYSFYFKDMRVINDRFKEG